MMVATLIRNLVKNELSDTAKAKVKIQNGYYFSLHVSLPL